MIVRYSNQALASAIVLSILGGQSGLAAGFEKSILWSGRYAGQGGAAVSSASGAEALYFNPAGLAGSTGSEVSLNVSPTFSKFSGPTASNNTTVDGKQTFSPVFGALANYVISEKLAIGVGSYVSAGAKSEIENVSAGGKTHTPKTDLSAIEYAVGLGYEILPGLKLGGSYRITQVNADLTFMSGFGASATPVGSVSLSDMKATNSQGYRLGASYSGTGWGLGATYRSAVDFTLEGTSSGTIPGGFGGGTGVFTGGSATAASTIPSQLSIGGFYDVNSDLKINAEYVSTEYSKVNQISLNGSINVSGSASNLSGSPVLMNWADQTNYRIGGEYSGISGWTLRAGYVYTSQVTNSALARSTLTPPGVAHSVTAGFTTGLTSNIDFSAAGEYSTASGTATATAAAATLAGDYSASGYMLHTGVNYKF